MMNRFYNILPTAENSADVYIYGDITAEPWLDGDMSAHRLVSDLKALNADRINVHIDSYGGDVSEGWAIYNALRESNAEITTYADGFVASAALYPFLAGDRRIASSLSAFYMHQVLSSAYGYAADLRRAADDADKMTEIGIAAFAERAGMNVETVRDLMQRETWLTPTEAMYAGIVTEIVSEREKGATQSAKQQIMQRIFEKGQPEIKPKENKNERPSIMEMLAGIGG